MDNLNLLVRMNLLKKALINETINILSNDKRNKDVNYPLSIYGIYTLSCLQSSKTYTMDGPKIFNWKISNDYKKTFH